jgi:phosphodiesterase/alkaline phosphatase D-like protein
MMTTLGAIVALAILCGAAPAQTAATLPNRVASGDVLPSSAWLWTRTTCPGPVRFRFSMDPTFQVGVRTRTVNAASSAQPVKA